MVGCTDEAAGMKMFIDVSEVYLHRDPVDFRKSINGLSAIVELSMNLPLNSDALSNKLQWLKSGRTCRRVSSS